MLLITALGLVSRTPVLLMGPSFMPVSVLLPEKCTTAMSAFKHSPGGPSGKHNFRFIENICIHESGSIPSSSLSRFVSPNRHC